MALKKDSSLNCNPMYQMVVYTPSRNANEQSDALRQSKNITRPTVQPSDPAVTLVEGAPL